jgi:hypothetical protein
MAKLTKQQWADARQAWETDPREGHQWLADELVNQGFEVNRSAIAKAAKRQGWAKKSSRQNVPENVTQSDKKSLERVTANVTKPSTQKPKEVIVIADPEWEEVDEKAERMHGNSKYHQRFDEMARKLCLLGATDADMADFFHVSESTINLWKLAHASFSESIRDGKMMADANMAERLYLRGLGYSHPDTHVSCYEGKVILTELTKHYPPDTKAAIHWLNNRRPDKWRNRVDVKEEVTISQIPWEELREITRQSVEKSLQKHQEFIEGRYERLGIKREYSSE